MRNPPGYWTVERLKADALRFQTKSAWKKGSAGYQAAHRLGILEECCGHMDALLQKRTMEQFKSDALRFQTRGDWQKGSPAAYDAAHRLGILEKCCGHMEVLQASKGYWNLARLQAVALRFQTRGAWQKGAQSSYSIAHKQGLLEECCGHMESPQKPNGYWTPARLRSDALRFQTRAAWRKGSPGVYSTAAQQGLLEECCKHMGDPNNTPSDNDTVYFWKAEGTEFYKIGVTSERLGMQRIDRVAEASGFTPVVLAMTTINGKATDVETELLRKFNRSAGLEGFDGCTEFRHLASWEAAEVVSILATANN